jgi:hypothetical protein
MDTLRAQMDDLARGARIKARREELHLSQPAVVDLMNERAPADLRARDKRREGKIIRLRGYQEYEAGGGIEWEKAKVLAAVLGSDTHWLMTGENKPTATPDLMAVPEQLENVDGKFTDLVGDVSEQLDRIEGLLSENNQALHRLMRMVDEGLFTPRADGESRDAQIGLGAALASVFQAPEAQEALRQQIQPPAKPSRTGRARDSRKAAS